MNSCGHLRSAFAATALCACALLLSPPPAQSNNLRVTNVTAVVNDESTVRIAFDVSWENSWRDTDINHDAAWVFFKVREDGSEVWLHGVLDADQVLNPTGFTVGSGTELDFIVPEDKVGMFVRRKNEGSGLVASTNVSALWNFSSNGLAKTARVFVQAFAVEMVYVAEGPFYLGCGAPTNKEAASITNVQGSFTDGAWTAGTPTNFPYLVTSENAITMDNSPGNLWGTSSSGEDTIGPVGVLSNAFPKGYAPFYCMKYEITQGQYRDFLNTLTREQQNKRTQTQLPDSFVMKAYENNDWTVIGQRVGIRCPAVVPDPPGVITFGCDANANRIFNEPDDAENRACGNFGWGDIAAYADWAGLRPMTELEFEKACRGPLSPVPCEFAWGSTNIVVLSSQNNDGTGYATVSAPAGANCYYDNTMSGPRRVGLYATASSSREQSGGSYWGIMELTGNVNERVISVSQTAGRSFTGLHGDGTLDGYGDADVSAWPGSTAAGTGMRGGRWHYTKTYGLHTSNRGAANKVHPNRYYSNNNGCLPGARHVRTAPAGIGP